MTSDREEGFLGRWARLKRRGAVEETAQPDQAPDQTIEAGQAGEGGATAELEPFDPASLPDLDTLHAASDYTAFLKPNVPRELKTLALRRAWVTDPAITSYKTLADYDWDFNAPGYGALRVTDDVVDLAKRVFGMIEPEEKPAAEADAEPEAPVPDPDAAGDPEIRPAIAEALPEPALGMEPVIQDEPVVAEPQPAKRRRHGRAMPTVP
ncbi:hypothetical protein N825_27985 [Skermanella stibiiresistens SB22]|uniref:DUF3306 domain-containing protein n=1 Tax=Skermanella stibiiresistens SB22 TaxID=1385369 RepID=W9H5P7_9PROT|nr:DUF3306 domain-containing protein [Skermanella stibiiresistens]EWY41369.1 hypothetical protein N825_27985 [Skermanella stibiiresistens SB22]